MRHVLPSRVLLAAPLAVAPSACSVKKAETAAAARSDLIGVSAEDLSLCAGLPTRTERVDPRTELREYDYKTADANAVSLNIPVIGGGVNVGHGGACAAAFKMVDGRVAELRYAGATDSGPGGTDSVCAPIVRHCVSDMTPDGAAAR